MEQNKDIMKQMLDSLEKNGMSEEKEEVSALLDHIHTLEEQLTSIQQELIGLRQEMSAVNEPEDTIGKRIFRGLSETINRCQERTAALWNGLQNVKNGIAADFANILAEQKMRGKAALAKVKDAIQVTGKLKWIHSCLTNGVYEVSQSVDKCARLAEQYGLAKEQMSDMKQGIKEAKGAAFSPLLKASIHSLGVQETVAELQAKAWMRIRNGMSAMAEVVLAAMDRQAAKEQEAVRAVSQQAEQGNRVFENVQRIMNGLSDESYLNPELRSRYLAAEESEKRMKQSPTQENVTEFRGTVNGLYQKVQELQMKEWEAGMNAHETGQQEKKMTLKERMQRADNAFERAQLTMNGFQREDYFDPELREAFMDALEAKNTAEKNPSQDTVTAYRKAVNDMMLIVQKLQTKEWSQEMESSDNEMTMNR